jgi:protein SCO1/2
MLLSLLLSCASPGPGPGPESPPTLAPGQSVPEGSLFPTVSASLASGGTLTIGQGQTGAIALTFVYTRCPMPEYCPLVVSKLQGLQEILPAGARIVVVTLDPEHDTRSVLQSFAETSGAVPGRWDFARVPNEILFGLAEKAGLRVHGKDTAITHDLVLLVIDPEGRLVRRIEGGDWDRAEVAALLTPPAR